VVSCHVALILSHIIHRPQAFARAVASGFGDETMSTIPFRERYSCTIDEGCEASGLGRTKMYEILPDLETVKVGKRRLIIVQSLLSKLESLREPKAA
jgi:hypothetical protein